MAKILIVEDDGALRQDLADKLEDWGHEVQQAGDGLQGFDVLEKWHPDLILSDVDMPECSGITMAEYLSEPGSPWSDVSFLFISSGTSRAQILKGIASGADDYLVKPIDYYLLHTAITFHLENREAFLENERQYVLTSKVKDSIFVGSVLASTVGATLVVAIVVAYWLKSALGIDVFQDVHLSDVFLG